MVSIHFIITKYILTGIFLVALVTGVIIDKFTQQQFNSQFNKTLQHKAWTLATLTDQKYGKVEFDFADEMMPEFESSESSEYFQLWLGNGDLLEKSHSLADKELHFLKIDLGDTVFQDIELPDGKPGRFVAIHFTPQLDDDVEEASIEDLGRVESHDLQTVTLIIAKNTSELIQNLLINRVVILFCFISMLLISYVIIFIATKNGLSPLMALASQVQRIDDQSLDAEIQIDNVYSELTSITNQLNKLFSRLSDSFKREKRFSSNVSHELRTPIAELIALSGVVECGVDNPETINQFFKDTKEIALEMSQIVTTLRSLTQSDSGAVTKELTVFNLHECIKTAIKRSNLVNKNNLKIEWDQLAINNIQVYSDEGKFCQILTNIISNAFKYGRTESAVFIRPTLHGHILSLSISNYSSDLEAEDLEYLTEYFWRKDQARTGGENTGLGLTLVKMLCQVLNIKLDFKLTKDKLFTVTISNLSVHEY